MDNVTLIRIISGVLAVSVFLLPLYVLPTILAWKKTHRMPILLLNLLLGWTVLGWIGALVWALNDTPANPGQLGGGAFCSNCGKHRPALAQFCSSCGHPLAQNPMQTGGSPTSPA
jgi:hypothetical protein